MTQAIGSGIGIKIEVKQGLICLHWVTDAVSVIAALPKEAAVDVVESLMKCITELEESQSRIIKPN